METNDLNDLSPQAFESWLKTDRNSNLLKKIAAKIYYDMQYKKLNLSGVDIGLIEQEEIFQELVIFLLKDEKTRKNLITGCPQTMKHLNKFLWHRMVDKSRTRETNQDIHKNTWRIFYRHVTDVMGKSDLFFKTNQPGKPLIFGLTLESPRKIIMIEDLMDIGYPQDVPTYFQTLNTKKNILRLTLYFWDQAAQKTGEPHIRLSIGDFMSWVGQYVDMSDKIDSYSETNHDENLDKHLPRNKDTANLKQEPEDIVKKQSLTTWADNFFNKLKTIEKKVFYYYECKGLSHKEVSGLMHKKGTLSYQRDKIRDNLKDFLRPLDWVSSGHGTEPYDKADFIFFMNHLCSQLSAAIEGALSQPF